jgi:magnesium transporter
MIRLFKITGGEIEPVTEINNGVWIRITKPTAFELHSISEKLNISPYLLNAATDSEESSRWESDNNIMSMIIDVPYKTDNNGFITVPLSVIVSDNKIVTVCSADPRIAEKRLPQMCNESGLEDAVGFAIRLMYMISEEYQQNLIEINDARKKMEDRLHSAIDTSDMLELHRMEIGLVHFVTSLKGFNLVLNTMSKYVKEKTNAAHIEKLDEVIIENQQAIEMATIYREIVNSTRDLFSTVITIKLNVNMRWLTAVTIILSIPMIIVGLYGMNVHLPIASSPLAFITIIIVTIIICMLVAILLRLKKLI